MLYAFIAGTRILIQLLCVYDKYDAGVNVCLAENLSQTRDNKLYQPECLIFCN